MRLSAGVRSKQGKSASSFVLKRNIDLKVLVGLRMRSNIKVT